MEDFNADNAKIDAALQAEAAARAADKSGLTSMITLRNCRVECFSYTGSAAYNQPSRKTVQFSKRPVVFFVFGKGSLMVGAGGSTTSVLLYEGNMTERYPHQWEGSTLILQTNDGITGMNNTGYRYYAVGLIAED